MEIKARSQNHASQHVASALGFTHEGTEREADCDAKGHFYNMECYSLLESEWTFYHA